MRVTHAINYIYKLISFLKIISVNINMNTIEHQGLYTLTGGIPEQKSYTSFKKSKYNCLHQTESRLKLLKSLMEYAV